MNEALYWIWLQTAIGYGEKVKDLVSYYTTAENFYRQGENSWRASGLFTAERGGLSAAKLGRIKNTPLKKAEEISALCEKHGVTPIVPTDERYPNALKNIEDFPLVIYSRGDISCLNDNLTIAAVGTRNPSQYGLNAAKKIIGDLAKNDVTVVSGGALGLDSVAHSETIANGGKTVLVLSCGHDYNYLPENAELRSIIEQNGAVISEYPPEHKSGLINFNLRNRIISGLSKAVVVFEAGKRSGTLNTAGRAKQQGVDVYVLPGDFSAESFKGSNELIKQGAFPIFSASDILTRYNLIGNILSEVRSNSLLGPFDGIDIFDYGSASENKSKRTKSKQKNKKEKIKSERPHDATETEASEKENEEIIKNILENTSPNAKMVYNHISNSETPLDDIVRKCKLPVNKVLSSLTELEMLGVAECLASGRYKRK